MRFIPRQLRVEQLENRELLTVDLEVRIEGPLSATPGNEVRYFVQVTNQGSDLARGIDVTSAEPNLLSELSWSCPTCNGFDQELELSALGADQGFFVQGLDHGDLLGAGVDVAGDINGDGISDILLGATGVRHGPRDTGLGSVYVVFGSRTAFPGNFDLSTLDGSNGFSVHGVTDAGIGGRYNISGVGDVNGDGFDDIAIAAAGGAHVIFGRLSFDPILELTSLELDSGFFLSGGISYVNNAGDVNADGYADIVLGGVYGDIVDFEERGWVVFGTESGFPSVVSVDDVDGSNGFAVLGTGGRSVSGAGDFNGDGISDVLLGSINSGSISVLFGTAELATEFVDVRDFDGDNGLEISVSLPSGAAEFVGDVNGDEIDDIVFLDRDPPAAGSGEDGRLLHAVIYGSRDGFEPIVEAGDIDIGRGFQIRSEATLPVVAAGDVNGDSVNDLILSTDETVGAPSPFPGFGSEGRVYVVLGREGGLARSIDLSGPDPDLGFVMNGFLSESATGYSLSGAGDFNGDGVDDILIGAPTAMITKGDQGQVYAVLGRSKADGDGPLTDIVDLGPGETVIYEVTGTVPVNATGSIVVTIAATTKPGQMDVDTSNNVVIHRIELGGGFLGDLDFDGVVAFSDFLTLSSNFGRDDGVKASDGDIDGDGVVGFSDFLILAANFGKGPA